MSWWSALIYVLLLCEVCTASKKFLLQTERKVNWHEAYQMCAAKGLRLASVSSAEEHNTLIASLRQSGYLSESMWLSGSNFAEGAQFYWMNTGQPFIYSRWGDGQPNKLASENCVLIRPDGATKMSWNNVPCDKRMFFICEKCGSAEIDCTENKDAIIIHLDMERIDRYCDPRI